MGAAVVIYMITQLSTEDKTIPEQELATYEYSDRPTKPAGEGYITVYPGRRKIEQVAGVCGVHTGTIRQLYNDLYAVADELREGREVPETRPVGSGVKIQRYLPYPSGPPANEDALRIF